MAQSVFLYNNKIISGFHGSTMTKNFKSCRKQIEQTLDLQDTMIGGEGIEIEIDESKVGKVQCNRGHRVDGIWILGGVEWSELSKENAF